MSDDKSTVVYSLETQHDNLGDFMINDLLIYEIGKHAKVIIDDYNVPEDFKGRLSLCSFELASEFYSFSTFKSIQGLISLLFKRVKVDFIVQTPGHTSVKDFRMFVHILKTSFYVLLARIRGVRFLRIGMSYAELNFWGKFAISILHASGATPIARDGRSGPRNGFNLQVLPDLIYLADSSYFMSPTGMVPICGQKIIFSFRWDNIPVKERKKFGESIFNLATSTSERFGVPVFITYQVQRDRELFEFLRKLHNDSGKSRCLVFIAERVQREDVNEFYGESALVVSNRLHVSLTAIVAGGIGIACVDSERDGKIVSIFSESVLSDLLVLDSLLVSEKIEKISEIYKNKIRLKERLAVFVEEQRMILRDSIKKIFIA